MNISSVSILLIVDLPRYHSEGWRNEQKIAKGTQEGP